MKLSAMEFKDDDWSAVMNISKFRYAGFQGFVCDSVSVVDCVVPVQRAGKLHIRQRIPLNEEGIFTARQRKTQRQEIHPSSRTLNTLNPKIHPQPDQSSAMKFITIFCLLPLA